MSKDCPQCDGTGDRDQWTSRLLQRLPVPDAVASILGLPTRCHACRGTGQRLAVLRI